MGHIIKPTQLKPFDLKVGDRVRSKSNQGVRDERLKGVGEITAIYPSVFIVKSIYGYSTAFAKVDYQLGEVEKVKE